MVVFLFIINILNLKCIINKNNIYAHEENLGIEGYSGIEYDECEPYAPQTTGTTSSYGEKWYILHSVVYGIDNSSHIDNDIETVYYRFYNEGSKTNEAWLSNYEYYKDITCFGFDKWNYVAAYKEDSNGVLQVVPIVKLVNVDTLENSYGIEEHIEVHIYDDLDKSYSISANTDIGIMLTTIKSASIIQSSFFVILIPPKIYVKYILTHQRVSFT